MEIRIACLALLLAACGGSRTHALRRQAALDLGCPEGQVRVWAVPGAGYLAEACGRRTTYTFARETGPVRSSGIEVAGPGTPLAPLPVGGSTPPPPPPP
jgi:hypothetical protein